MQRHYFIISCVIALQINSGCNHKDGALDTPPRVSPTPAVRTAAKTSAKMEPNGTEAKSSTVVDKSAPVSAKPVAIHTEKKSTVAVNKPERMAILAPGGPIVVDLLLTIDGRPHAGQFEDLIDQLLKAADSDKDGRPTWRELVQNKEYLAAQGANTSFGETQFKMLLEQFDRNQDGQIQRDEAAAWLGRDAGVTARAFDVRGTRSYAAVPSATSRIWKLLDADHDNRLSKEEIARSAATLLSLDENDDGMITPGELVPLPDQLRTDGDRVSNNAPNPYAAIYLEPQYEVGRLEYLLTDLYASQQVLRPASFLSLARIYKELDSDGDDQLTQDELEAMRTMRPQLKLAVDFRSENGRGDVQLNVTEHIPELEVVQQPAADRVILKLGATRIVVLAYDRMPGQTSSKATGGSEIRMLVHDQCDPLGELLDTDADGRLSEREIATAPKLLLKLDANNDGEISNEELPYFMITAIVRGEPPGDQSLYRPVSRLTTTTLSAPSWFLHADYNGDGYISPREFLGTMEQFSSLDKNRDGFISADEAENFKAAGKMNHQ